MSGVTLALITESEGVMGWEFVCQTGWEDLGVQVIIVLEGGCNAASVGS